jgi:uncharacterized protein
LSNLDDRIAASVKTGLIFAGIGLLGLTAALNAEGDPAAVLRYQRTRQEQNAAIAAHRLWLWQIDAPHAQLWIIGCLHLAAPEDMVVYPAYLPYYQAASTVYFETVPGSWNSYEARQLLGRRGYLEDHQSLSTRISRATWHDLEAYLASRPEERAAISTMEPWLAAFTLIQDGYARAGLHSEDSLESLIERSAIADRKPVGGLEAPKEQILAMADAPLPDQEDFLRNTLAGLKDLSSQTQALREAWVAGTEDRLRRALGVDSTAMRSTMHQNLLAERNRRWVRKLQEIAERGKNVLILVGVEHLVTGPDALPDLLGKAGFAVHRIEPRATKAGSRGSVASGASSIPYAYPYRGQPAQ